MLHGPSFENRISLSVFAVSNFYRHCGFIDAHQQCWNIFRMFTTLLHHASCDGATVSYRLGVTVSCRLGATVSYLLGATLSYRLGAIGPRLSQNAPTPLLPLLLLTVLDWARPCWTDSRNQTILLPNPTLGNRRSWLFEIIFWI